MLVGVHPFVCRSIPRALKADCQLLMIAVESLQADCGVRQQPALGRYLLNGMTVIRLSIRRSGFQVGEKRTTQQYHQSQRQIKKRFRFHDSASSGMTIRFILSSPRPPGNVKSRLVPPPEVGNESKFKSSAATVNAGVGL